MIKIIPETHGTAYNRANYFEPLLINNEWYFSKDILAAVK